ncbi:MAG: hypothetical protein M3Q23_11655 [Actinomycetota bacterium]|nr:hypothetical protein [Actinomycetota bacterium]
MVRRSQPERRNPGGDRVGNGGTWFAETSANKIANTAGTEVTVPTPASQPTGVTPGPDGSIWFMELAGNKIGRLVPTTHAITEFPMPTANSAPNQITFGPDGNLWFTELAGNKIGRITPKDAIMEFAVPTPGSSPRGIVTGPDRNVWFTEYAGGKIGRITPAGVITEYPLPDSHGAPAMIAAAPDGSVWFTDDRGGSGEPEQIGRIQVTGPGVFFLDGAPVPRTMNVAQGTTARWNVYGGFKVSIVDSSGMGLFASGTKGLGSMYTFTFVGAGTYRYYNGLDGSGPNVSGAIAVPVQASPTSGTTSTSFTITWSSAPPPSGFVFDVQVNGPTDADFVDLLTNQTATSTTFTPNEGPGGYFFRARLRKTSDNTHSNWSPPVAIAVS